MTKYNSKGVEVFDFKPPYSKEEIIRRRQDSKQFFISAPSVSFRPERIESKGKDEL
jgi:hypothetical protein